MQTMELVDIEDVYPYEENDVRMNPRDVTSRECREYIAQLAEQFRHNRLNPGQPRVRPILYRDGGIYQIVDGECRYEAMKLAGTRRFYADVFDDLADAETARQEAAKAMVETDAKRALTPEEMSRGIQTMLALDVPDEEIAASARIDAGKVGRARRAARATGDAAYDMTLDRLLAIGEFDGSVEGDDEAVAALRDCAQGEWRYVYERAVKQRAHNAAAAAVRAVCAERGCAEYEGEAPEGTVHADSVFLDERAAERVASVLDETPGATCQVGGNWVEIRRPETEEDRSEEEGRRERRDAESRERDHHRELWDVEASAQETWLVRGLADLASIPRTAALLADRVMETTSDLVSRTGAELDFSPTPEIVAVGWCRSWRPTEFTAVAAAMGRLQVYQATGEQARAYAELADAMEGDGYEENDTGRAVAEAMREFGKGNR